MDEGSAIPEGKIEEAFAGASRTLPLRIPVSTYRLQFNRDFTFRDAVSIVPYLDSLGITDIYSSPYFKARRGSEHGYDIVEHNELNPEVGSVEDYGVFTSEIRKHGMGQILDIVPNHMSIESSGNRWWADVLENGQSSLYSHYFDIDWNPVKRELKDKVIIPILGDQYGRALENQELRLVFDSGAFFIEYYTQKLPLDPKTYELVISHRLSALRDELGDENPRVQELLSIITSLKNLPPRTEKGAEKIAERMREKEVIKRRLNDLYEESREFSAYLDANVRIFNGVKNDSKSFDPLDELLGTQVYRLAFWRVATEEINYRRFFDINDLAAIRMEEREVFRETHRLVFRLIREGKVTGLRADHPDGLQNPKEYFRMLQEECFIQLCLAALGTREEDHGLEERFRALYGKRLDRNPALRKPLYVAGEKILMGEEDLPADWPVFGTTGYVFMNSSGGVFVDTSNIKAFDGIYSRFIKSKVNYSRLLYEKKKLIMESSMASEINVLAHSLNLVSESDRNFRDFTLNNLIDAIVEVIAFFPVYRTYIDGPEIDGRDLRYIGMAVSNAKRHRHDLSALIFDFLKDVLTLDLPEKFDERQRRQCLDFTLKFQQLTGPVMAKGLEDTVFYTFNRLASLNEVGGSPEKFGTHVEAFHRQNAERQKRWPYALTATSTHDSKRSEDVRARINALSEMPELWKSQIARWARTNRKWKTIIHGEAAPDRNDEYLFYQTILGAWPHGQMEAGTHESFKQRISRYMLKAAREAKHNTTWINPNAGYEEALMRFTDRALSSRRFIDDLLPFMKTISNLGMFNSLSHALLKITSPGVPDFYQGTELWNLVLVDPDNRGQVDYALRLRLLEELKGLENKKGLLELSRELTRTREDGRIKLYLIYKALSLRKERKDLFLHGKYMPIYARGSGEKHIVAFGRSDGGNTVITVVPRLLSAMIGASEAPTGGVWKDTRLVLPLEGGVGKYRDIFTGRAMEAEADGEGTGSLMLSEVLSDFPVALLEGL
jgi:(1->4)-alpha-D-glucan 1-alpha-D-glucosylmutase